LRDKDRLGRDDGQALAWGPAVREGLREAVREFILATIDEEAAAVLGVERHERAEGRAGYRNGTKPRRVTTCAGPLTLAVPRARLFTQDGGSEEWRDHVLPRYARRSPDVDAAVLGMYLSGVNTRKVKAALRPLLGKAPLSRSAVSRIVERLRRRFEEWSKRPLTDEKVVHLYLDGLGVKVRLGGKVVSVPVLAALGVRADGTKVLLALELAGAEATEAWKGVLDSMVARGLRVPILCIVDGSGGLGRAIKDVWPRVPVQRCTVHKLRNLEAKAPKHLHEELRDDYRAFVYAESPAEVRAGHAKFLAKWEKLCPSVATSLREAGEDLLTFTKFPKEQWRSLRTTNVIERLNGEFRRRVKTQGSLPSEQAAVVLLFALVDQGVIRMRKMEGKDTMADVLLAHGRHAA
jgi:transposase-like protein